MVNLTGDFGGGGIQPVHVWVSLMAGGATVCAFLWRISSRLKKINDVMVKFMVEHEMLIADYCDRESARTGKVLRPQDLPTRQDGLLKH